jgi:hypothetical protein
LDDNKRNSTKEEDKSKIVTGLLSRLELSEDSLEVKGCTVKNFGLISKYLKENEIIQIFSKIITYITDQKAVGKDIYVTCIKAILKEMSGPSCHTVGKVIIPEIQKGIKSNNQEIQELCFDAFNDYLNTFNYVLIKESESVIKYKDDIVLQAISLINVNNQSLRNRISSFLGNFSVILNKKQMSALLEGILGKIKHSNDINEKISLLTTLNSVAKNTANRHADYLKCILPLIFEFSNRKYLEDNMHEYDLNNDLVECGLSLLETYILKLSSQMKSETEKIVTTVLDLMEYDPNFVYSNESDQMQESYGDYNYEGYEGYEAFVYADDSSWKVRRASVRVIHALIKSRVEIQKHLVEIILDSLVKNVREHEETTKLDIIHCLSRFLRNFVIEDESINVNTINKDDESTTNDYQLVKQKSVTSFIPMIVNKLIENIITELKSKNQKIKSAILQLLSSLALIDPYDLVIRFKELQPHLESCLKENISALTFFVFLTRMLKSLKNCPEVTQLFDDLLNWVIVGLRNDYYKINIEGLNVAFHFIRLLVENLQSLEYQDKIETLLKEIMPKFKANDVDQELKLSLISTVGNLVLYTGHTLSDKSIDEIFNIYLDKIKNENLRPLVFNWLIRVIKHNPNVNLSRALSPFVSTLLDLLSKNILHLQYQTLEFLLTIITHCPQSISGQEVKIIETLLVISNEDSLIQLIYEILNIIIQKFNISQDIHEAMLKRTLQLIEENKISNNSLNSIFIFIQNCVKFIDVSKLNNYISSILNLSNMNFNKAKSIAIMAKAGGSDEKLIETCINKLKTKSDDVTQKNILLVLGELSLVSSSGNKSLLSNLEKMLPTCNEDIKSSLAICIGKVGVRDPQDFIQIITSNNNKQSIAYHFVAIREFLHVISSTVKKDISNIVSLFNILVSCAKDEDEKLRILCGENLGLISLLSEELLKEYIKYLQNNDKDIRSTFYYGLKYIFNSKYDLKNYLNQLLDLLIIGLSDSDIQVKQNSFNSLITFVHNYGNKIRGKYSELSSVFKKEHVINPELVATVDIGGGMRIKNDKGLPIRKAIYSTIKLLLDCIPEKINITETLQMCLYGLGKKKYLI